jgi:hypothetical protein
MLALTRRARSGGADPCQLFTILLRRAEQHRGYGTACDLVGWARADSTRGRIVPIPSNRCISLVSRRPSSPYTLLAEGLVRSIMLAYAVTHSLAGLARSGSGCFTGLAARLAPLPAGSMPGEMRTGCHACGSVV